MTAALTIHDSVAGQLILAFTSALDPGSFQQMKRVNLTRLPGIDKYLPILTGTK